MDANQLLFGNGLANLVAGNNPQWQAAFKYQLPNFGNINQAAWNAYNNMGGTPQQIVAGMDPLRQAGIQNQIANATGQGQQLAQTGAGTLNTIQGGAGAGQSALQAIAGGQGPQFSNQTATDYQNFMNSSLLGAQQALANQANLAWNKGVGNVGGVGTGFMNSGRENALGQAAENAATTLGANQQQLAYQAAANAANAGQQSGIQGFQGQLQAGQALGNQALQGAQLTNNLQNAGIFGGQIQEAGGVANQQQTQNQLNAQYQNQLLNQQQPFKNIQNLNAALGTLGTGTAAPNINVPSNTALLASLIGGTGGNTIASLLGDGANLAGSIGNGINQFSSWWNSLSPEQIAQNAANNIADFGNGITGQIGTTGPTTAGTFDNTQWGGGANDTWSLNPADWSSNTDWTNLI